MNSSSHGTNDQQHETAPGHDGGHDGGQDGDGEREEKNHERRMYWRFAAMIATSTAVMFVLTYSNTYQAGTSTTARSGSTWRCSGAARERW